MKALIDNLVRENPSLAIAILLAFIGLLGWFEAVALREKRGASLTWFLGLLIACAYLSGLDAFGELRWAISILVFSVGSYLIIRFYKETE